LRALSQSTERSAMAGSSTTCTPRMLTAR
jgi:hypothetical protein